MKRIIHKIRLQPPEIRVIVAVIGALILTVILGYFWSRTLSLGPVQIDRTNTSPNPFQVLVGNIKDVFKNSDQPNPLTVPTNSVEVIDAGTETQ